MLDRRFKHRLRETQKYYIFIKNKLHGIFYVRYADGRQISTRTTDINKAYQFAQEHMRQDSEAVRFNLHEVLEKYYSTDSDFQKYDINHGIKIEGMTLKNADTRSKVISELLSDVKNFSGLTRRRLIRLQEQLLEKGLSAKSVNNYMTDFHRVIKQMFDREIISSDPFISLKQVKGEKQKRVCFPVGSVKGKFSDTKLSLLAYVAIATGARRGEFFKWEISENVLRIHGTKSIYSDRSVPISEETARKIRLLETMEIKDTDYRKSVDYMSEILGIHEEGIVFHSFRKMFKTILTSANLNTTLIETMMGHSNNQQSNNVERIYFVEESAELSEVYELVRETMRKYLDT